MNIVRYSYVKDFLIMCIVFVVNNFKNKECDESFRWKVFFKILIYLKENVILFKFLVDVFYVICVIFLFVLGENVISVVIRI